jgi:hypothetical protein
VFVSVVSVLSISSKDGKRKKNTINSRLTCYIDWMLLEGRKEKEKNETESSQIDL